MIKAKIILAINSLLAVVCVVVVLIDGLYECKSELRSGRDLSEIVGLPVSKLLLRQPIMPDRIYTKPLASTEVRLVYEAVECFGRNYPAFELVVKTNIVMRVIKD